MKFIHIINTSTITFNNNYANMWYLFLYTSFITTSARKETNGAQPSRTPDYSTILLTLAEANKKARSLCWTLTSSLV